MLTSVKNFFGIDIPFEKLNTKIIKDGWILASDNYVFASRLFEILSQVTLAPQLLKSLDLKTDIVIDTMTIHFGLGALRFNDWLLRGNLKTLCYVHYPFTVWEVCENFFK